MDLSNEHKNRIFLISFLYSHEVGIAKSKLESENIEVYLKDENIVQAHPFSAQAIGGIKLFVKEEDYDKAFQIMKDMGHVNEEKDPGNEFLKYFDKLTTRIPIIGKVQVVLRLVILMALLILVIGITAILLSI